MEYTKPWLSIDEQIDKLVSRGVVVEDRGAAVELLRNIGYYRLTGYLYPFRISEKFNDEQGRERIRVTSGYRPGSAIDYAARLIDFDRELRLLVLEAVERIEVALRTQLGHTIGRLGPFAHEDAATYLPAFIADPIDVATGEVLPSPFTEWLARVEERRGSSDEAFVAHFREKYDDRMPIWALTEILELGQVARLYGGLRNDFATEIAHAFGVPTKRLMASWTATVNYVRNVAAHHARLFNRKLVTAPKRPTPAEVPLLAHLSQAEAPKQFGVYNALVVMAFLLRTVHPSGDWAPRVADLMRRFPTAGPLEVGSMGVVVSWLDEDIWQHRDTP